jgi:LytS/YehU family sensor histidine kinase
VLEVREKSNPAQVLRIRFVITPPFYKSWWFLLLVAVTAVAFVFFLFKRRLSAIKKQAALKQKIAETEMMALRAQMNPHFIFNCISSIDNFILGNQKENASTYLNKFARLIRNVLDNSKSDVVPFRKDWETIQLYLELEMIRSNHQFSYQLQASEVLLAGHYKIPPLIVQPYIENAIHHGLMQRNDNNGKLIVIADIDNELLRFTIQDNGIGRERSAALKRLNPLQHTSYGMQLSAERIAIFNNDQQNSIRITDLKDEDGNATGTLVEVLLHI